MRLPYLLLSLPLFLPSCGSSDPRALTDQGASALASGDAKGAQASFEKALAGLKPGDPDYARASMGRFQALVRSEPESARAEFLAYAKAQSASVTESDFATMVGEFLRRERTVEAVDVMDAGVKAFPKSEAMLAVRKKVEEQARAAKDPAAMQKMKGLGYIGGDK
jgi:Flp pilus assembly protein TadD